MLDAAVNMQMQNAIYQIVLRWIDDYLQEGKGGKNTGATLLRRPALLVEGNKKGNFDEMIQNISAKYNVDPKLVHAVVQAESNFDPSVESPAGAQGLMQLMPDTARELGVQNSFDPEQNLDGGVRYLRNMLDRYEGNVSLALAAYNAGPRAVSSYGGIPPYRETRTYVNQVLSMYQA